MNPIDDQKKTVRTPAGRFAPGTAGGPGRRPGRGPAAELRAALGEDLHPILQVLRAKALEGDVAAIRVILDRLVPPLKPEESATELELPEGSLSDAARAAIAAIGQGQLTPTQGAALISALAGAAKVIETSELVDRIERLEAARGDY